MIRLKYNLLVGAGVFLVFALALNAGQEAPKKLDQSNNVQALLILDTDDPSVGESVKVDGKNVRLLLEYAFKNKSDRLQITVLEGKTCTQEAILEFFRNLKPCTNDTLFVFYAGHGATHAQRGHGLAIQAGGKPSLLFRSDLRALMLAKNPRLAILISDCCGNYLGSLEGDRDPRYPEWKVIEALFLKPQGIVDINSVSEGESALGSRDGGFFTYNWTNLLHKEFGELYPSPDGNLYWHDILPLIQEKTQGDYGTYRQRALFQLSDKALAELKNEAERRDKEEMRKFLQNQEYQTIRVFQLPSVFRFGARLLDNDGDGLKIAFVHENSPAALAGFKPGDVLKKVGIQEVRNLDQFFQVLNRTQGELTIEFRRGRTLQQARVRLAGDRGTGQDF